MLIVKECAKPVISQIKHFQLKTQALEFLNKVKDLKKKELKKLLKNQ